MQSWFSFLPACAAFACTNSCPYGHVYTSYGCLDNSCKCAPDPRARTCEVRDSFVWELNSSVIRKVFDTQWFTFNNSCSCTRAGWARGAKWETPGQPAFQLVESQMRLALYVIRILDTPQTPEICESCSVAKGRPLNSLTFGFSINFWQDLPPCGIPGIADGPVCGFVELEARLSCTASTPREFCQPVNLLVPRCVGAMPCEIPIEDTLRVARKFEFEFGVEVHRQKNQK